MNLRNRFFMAGLGRDRRLGSEASDSASEAAGSRKRRISPFPGYDRLDEKEVGGRLHTLSAG